MKKRKQALFHSVIALLLCVSMLVGTTFAWFTDSVSSGKNQIVAGNLDVELEYLDAEGKWQTVNESTNVFAENTLWEPGHTEVVYLRVSNLGSLALKYQLGVNIAAESGSVNVNGDPFVLSDYIEFGAIEGVKEAYADRDAARAAVKDAKILSTGYTKDGVLEAGDEPHYVAFVVYMPETVGNEANYRTGEQPPQIDLGISLLATQQTSESDSFGNDYDYAAGFPQVDLPDGGETDVTVDGGKTTAGVTISGSAVSAEVPAGVAVNEGTTALSLSVTELSATGSNITLADSEVLKPIDVHVEGVSADNTQPITVTLKGFAAIGLNNGNLKLYHVENGETNAMTRVASVNDFTAHNQFTYDPATGDVTLYMATFSEVTLLSDTVNPWNGAYDTSWYNTTDTSFVIANADQFASFGSIVGGMAKDKDGNAIAQDSFSGKTVKLISDVNIGDTVSDNGLVLYPVGYYSSDGKYEKTGDAVTTGFYTFKGTFDGAGHTISNIYQNTWEMKGDHNWYDAELQYYRDGMGLFGKVYGGTVKNLTVEKFSSDGEITTTGTIAAYADCGATFENITIFNCNPRVYNIGNGGIVGCVGWYANDEHDDPVTFKNITVDNSNKISALWGSWDVACGGIVGQYYPTSGQENAIDNAGIYMENCHVAAQIDVYNDVCANYQYYAYRYAGMLIGSVRENLPADANGHVYPNMDGITASGCTVHFGTWNDYYYCELVDNTTASYTHDYQMSRLEEIKAIDGTTITYLDGTTGTVPASGRANYVIVDYTKGHGTENATCYHFKDGAVWTHDMGGIQTGIDENNDGQDDLKEDKQHIYLEFNNLVTGYGWGATSKGITDYDDAEVKILDKYNVEKFTKNDALDGNFLYRVGNMNAFPIGKLFQEVSEGIAVDSGVYVSVTSLVDGVDMVGTFVANDSDWTQSTLQITGGTGPAKLTIQDYNGCAPYEMIVEVVDAYNVTANTNGDITGLNGSASNVLLEDVDIADNSTLYLEGGTLYGNGFEIDASAAAYSGVSYDYQSYVINLKNSNLDNVQIMGKVYPSVGTGKDKEYYRPLVFVSGDCTIANSYLAYTASPIRTGGNLEIINSTIEGGTYANIDVRGGQLILDNVTTINQLGVNDQDVIGLGIVVYQEGGTDSMTITIKNKLTQYNLLSKSQANSIDDTTIKAVATKIFDIEAGTYQYDDGTTQWVNTGIISMNNLFQKDSIVDLRSDTKNYVKHGQEVTLMGSTRYCVVYSAKPTAITTPSTGYETAGQYHILPNVTADFTEKNYIAKSDDSNTYCIADNGVVTISMDAGDTFSWDTDILEVTKNGKTIAIESVKMNGTDYLGKKIDFDTAGTYTVEYQYTDNNNYTLNEAGEVVYYSKTYTKTIPIRVITVEKGAQNAVFSFGEDGRAYTSRNEIIGNKTYVMPDVTAVVDGEIGSTTVDGTTVYYPITEMYTSDETTSHTGSWYACFPIFKNAVQIVDYADNGTGDAITYNQTTVTTVDGIPSTLKATNPTSAFLYSMNATNYPPPTDPTAVLGAVCYTCNRNGLTSGNTRDEMTIIAEYTYTDNVGDTYYYYVGYHCAAQTSGGGCVAPDTLITLADGSQVRVDSLTGEEELLVWNLETGKLDSAPIMFVDSEEEAEYEIVHLYFSDGTDVEVIYEHGFWDYDLNKYVYLDTNAGEYIGHTFAKQNGDALEKVQLVDVVIEKEVTTAWSPVTVGHLCYFVNGMLSMPGGIDGLFNIFEVDPETMSYDTESMILDIMKYGTFTYEELNSYVELPEAMFEAAGGKYLKISIGKGLLTMDELIAMVTRYNKFFN